MISGKMKRLMRQLVDEGKRCLDVQSEEGLLLVVFGEGEEHNFWYGAVGTGATMLSMNLAAAHKTVRELPKEDRRAFIDTLVVAIREVCGKEVPHESA